MITSQEAAILAEKVLVQYASECGAQSSDDIRKVLEMLISKAARGIEKYAGHQAGVAVLVRTTERILTVPAKTEGRPL